MILVLFEKQWCSTVYKYSLFCFVAFSLFCPAPLSFSLSMCVLGVWWIFGMKGIFLYWQMWKPVFFITFIFISFTILGNTLDNLFYSLWLDFWHFQKNRKKEGEKTMYLISLSQCKGALLNIKWGIKFLSAFWLKRWHFHILNIHVEFPLQSWAHYVSH